MHFPVGMLGIQSSFHSVPLQYFQVQVLEGKKPYTSERKRLLKRISKYEIAIKLKS